MRLLLTQERTVVLLLLMTDLYLLHLTCRHNRRHPGCGGRIYYVGYRRPTFLACKQTSTFRYDTVPAASVICPRPIYCNNCSSVAANRNRFIIFGRSGNQAEPDKPI